tara:strand:+ start:946 stop:1695 length:750 start_codon:yes stop_codon:yes gene_type:complete
METESNWVTMSDDISELAAALANAQADINPARKTSENPFLKNKFADLNSVLDSVRPALSRNGIAFPQMVESDGERDYLVTLLAHKSGQWIRSRMKLTCEASKGTNANQAMGIAITYARRYSLTAMTGVSQEDNDAATAAPSNGVKEGESKKAKADEDANRKLRNLLKRLKKRWPDAAAEYCADILADNKEIEHIEHAKGDLADEIYNRLVTFGTMMHEEDESEERLGGREDLPSQSTKAMIEVDPTRSS